MGAVFVFLPLGVVGVVLLLAYALRCHLEAVEFEEIARHRDEMSALAPDRSSGRG